MCLLGYVEEANFSDFQFENQHKTFISYGMYNSVFEIR